MDDLQKLALKAAVYPENLTQPTLAPFCVRSKSEAIIVNALDSRNIPFVL
ncbi:MAG: hypothetical protein HFE73_10945 [Firmicutes bacterium]|nr:hypothetical protein [Bacillota bacterium]